MAFSSSEKLSIITSKKDSSSSFSSYFLLFSSTNNLKNHKKSLFTTLSIDSSSSYSRSCSVKHITKFSKKPLENVKTIDECFYDEEEEDNKLIMDRIGHIFNVKGLFGSDKIRSILLLNVITIVYASNIPVVKAVEELMDPAAFSTMRFVMSAIPFLPFVIQAKDDVQTRNAGIELGCWVSLGYLIEAFGLITSDAGRASFISVFTVLIVPLLDSMLGAIIPARTWFGVLMSVLGVAMLECNGSPPNIGDLLNFLSAIFFGIHTLRTEHILRSTKKKNFLPLLGYELCVVAGCSIIWAMIEGMFNGMRENDISPWTWTVMWDWIVAFPWLPALYTGVFSTGLCLWGEIAAMCDVSATETAIIYGLEPLWGAGFAWFLLGERWGTAGWAGAALVLGGSLMVQIFGTSTPNKSLNTKTIKHRTDRLLVSDKENRRLSASPIMVRSRKDVIDMLK